jgi:hypothetical protein
LNWANHLLVFADISLLGENINAMKRNTGAYVDPSKEGKEAGLEVNTHESVGYIDISSPECRPKS